MAVLGTVKDKIFCGCGEKDGGPRIGLKLEQHESEMMMKLPGIEKAEIGSILATESVIAWACS